MPHPEKSKLSVHPLVASLTTGGEEPESAVRFAGYIGESGQAGKVRLYLTLNDLSQYVEFEEKAVLHTAEAPENVLPQKGLFVWVKANSQVLAIRAKQMPARVVAAAIARGRRRLGMRMASGGWGAYRGAGWRPR